MVLLRQRLSIKTNPLVSNAIRRKTSRKVELRVHEIENRIIIKHVHGRHILIKKNIRDVLSYKTADKKKI